LKQAASKQALTIAKSQRKKKRKSKPEFNKLVMELDSRFVTILVKAIIGDFDLLINS
jgi:hypothetical protein